MIKYPINGGLFNPEESEIYLVRNGERIIFNTGLSNRSNVGGWHEPIVFDSLFSLTFFVDLVSNSSGELDQDTLIINYELQDLACKETEDEIFPGVKYLEILYNNELLTQAEGIRPTSFSLLIDK